MNGLKIVKLCCDNEDEDDDDKKGLDRSSFICTYTLFSLSLLLEDLSAGAI
jgi:hypothetical protein